MHGLPNLIDADTFRPLRPLRAAGGIIPYVSNFRAVAVDQMAGPIAPALRAQVTDAPRAAGALVVWSSIRRVSSIAPGPFLLGRCRYSSRDRLIEPDLSCGPIGWWLQKAPSKWPRSADSDRYAITGYRLGRAGYGLFLSSEQPGARELLRWRRDGRLGSGGRARPSVEHLVVVGTQPIVSGCCTPYRHAPIPTHARGPWRLA